MRVLVASASRYGATHEIADAVGATLRAAGLEVEVRHADEVSGFADFDAAVLGSAVYMGRWLEPARALVDLRAPALAGIPTWLFSSGPIGDPPKPAEDKAVQIDEIVEATGARGHVVFSGRLDKSAMRFGDRAVVTALRSPDGDFRDWDAIASWASGIAEDLGRSE
jgi:menaquinone-dependent protoporphyrinogen oxidase